MMNYGELMSDLLEVKLPTSAHFKIVEETLTRMGIGNKKKKILYKTCDIIEENGKFYIVHFKELFLLHGKEAFFVDGDICRRNKIALLLEEWGLLKIVDKKRIWMWNSEEVKDEPKKIFIISHKDKAEWECVCKYKPAEKHEDKIDD